MKSPVIMSSKSPDAKGEGKSSKKQKKKGEEHGSPAGNVASGLYANVNTFKLNPSPEDDEPQTPTSKKKKNRNRKKKKNKKMDPAGSESNDEIERSIESEEYLEKQNKKNSPKVSPKLVYPAKQSPKLSALSDKSAKTKGDDYGWGREEKKTAKKQDAQEC